MATLLDKESQNCLRVLDTKSLKNKPDETPERQGN